VETKVKLGPYDMKECCSKYFHTPIVKSLTIEGRTIPVCFRFCGICGTQIRPIKECCIKSTKYGFEFCTDCGAAIFKFFSLETKGVLDAQ